MDLGKLTKISFYDNESGKLTNISFYDNESGKLTKISFYDNESGKLTKISFDCVFFIRGRIFGLYSRDEQLTELNPFLLKNILL